MNLIPEVLSIEVADVIYNACKDYPTLRVNEIEIGRRA